MLPLALRNNFRKGGSMRLRLLPNQAKPLPSVSVTLGQRHIDIQQFCSRFNRLPLQSTGGILNILLRVHGGTSYDIIAKGSTISQMVKDLFNISKLSKLPRNPSGLVVTRSDVMDLAFAKAKDCNTPKLLSVAKSIVGTLTSMGITSER
ncbi:MAG: hypothetical protein ACTS6P_01515 [Candidatus Hodgkinia cicadicola]